MTGGGGCDSRDRAGSLPMDNSGVPLRHLAGDHSPERATQRQSSTHMYVCSIDLTSTKRNSLTLGITLIYIASHILLRI